MFSKACEYGIRATIYIAVESMQHSRVSLKEIARKIDSPMAFTAKILQLLARNHIIQSVKGPTGGFQIERKQIDSINLHQIVMAIDGDAIFKGCGLGFQACSEKHPCPIHDKFRKVRDELKEMAENTSIYEMASGLEIGMTHVKQ